MAATTYADLAKKNQSGANSNPNYSPYRDLIDNKKLDGSTQYAPSSQYNPAPTNQTTPSVVNTNSNNSSSSSSGINLKDPNANPGAGYFWDAADGWKQIQSDAAAEAARREEQLRNSIGEQWNGVFNYLDQVDNRLPGQKEEQAQQITSLYDSSGNKLDIAKNYANDQISANQKKTLTSLADDLRAALQAGNTYLGQRGASDSSASERYNTALTKSANKQRGEVMLQSDSQRAQVLNTYQTNMAELDEWKNTKIYELGQWLNEAKNQLDYQRANASGQKAQALASLDTQLHQYALERLRSIEEQANTWKNTVSAWMLEQSGNVNNAVSNMQNMPMVPTYSALAQAQSTSQNSTPILGAGTNQTDDEKAGQSDYYFSYSSANPSANTKMTF